MALEYLKLLNPLLAVYRGFRKIWPARETKRKSIADEFAHAARLKKDFEAHTKWDKTYGTFGEFLVRDIERVLPNSQENHSSKTSPASIVGLTKIEREYVEFTYGSFGIQHIKQMGDRWFESDAQDPGAIRVERRFWVNYRDIVMIRWETDEYWEWPQVCCRFSSPNRFPLSRLFFAQEIQGAPRPYFKEVCLCDDVSKIPDGLVAITEAPPAST